MACTRKIMLLVLGSVLSFGGLVACSPAGEPQGDAPPNNDDGSGNQGDDNHSDDESAGDDNNNGSADDNDNNNEDSDGDDDDNDDDNDNGDDDNDNNDDVDTDDPSSCGDGNLDSGEVCDSDTVACGEVDPKYVAGDAVCQDDCAGYDISACEENIALDDMAGKIQQASRITGLAHMAVLEKSEEWIGKYERDVKAFITEKFSSEGADSDFAFSHIVASGPNATDLHYAGGDRMLAEGDLVKIDIGAKYQEYCGDITRTFPVSGVFSDRQKELYQLVLDSQMGAAAHMEYKVHTLSQMTQWVKDFFKKSPLRAKDENGQEHTMDHFFIHALSHFIGKKVHGQDLDINSSDPPPLDYVFSIEPGLYIKSEGIGIRIEDDYVMTENGAVNVWKNTIKTVDDIEEMMGAVKSNSYDYLFPTPLSPSSPEGSLRTDHMIF